MVPSRSPSKAASRAGQKGARGRRVERCLAPQCLVVKANRIYQRFADEIDGQVRPEFLKASPLHSQETDPH